MASLGNAEETDAETLLACEEPADGRRSAVRRRGNVSAGDRVGRYMVLDLLGSGGMGEVYSAYDPELDRKVAIKLLHTELGVGTACDAPGVSSRGSRLLREAQALAKLDHRNVVTVYDAGRFHDDVFMAMALVEGRTLRQWINDEDPSWREVLRAYVEAGEGLAAAHRCGLVHRDFKPDNALIDNSGSVRVLDFGLVHGSQSSIASILADDNALRRVGGVPTPTPRFATTEFLSVVGTPAFMAPEQHDGQPTTARSDQFSFCVALYEGLYRQRPFAWDTRDEIRQAMNRGVCSPNDGRNVPQWLRRRLLRGLSLQEPARYPDMSALLEDLRRDPSVRRRRLAVIGVMALAAVGGVGEHTRRQREKEQFCSRGAEAAQDVWNDDARDRVRRAFTGLSLAYAPAAFATASTLLDSYVRDWTTTYREACEATHLHRQQSQELLGLRTACLEEHLDAVEGLVDVFADADPVVVETSLVGVHSLPGIARCDDAPALLANEQMSTDPTTDAEIRTIRRELSRLRALQRSADLKALEQQARELLPRIDAVGSPRLTAEALLLLGAAQCRSRQYNAAVQSYRRAMYAAVGMGASALAGSALSELIFTEAFMRGDTSSFELYLGQGAAFIKAAGNPPELMARYHTAAAATLDMTLGRQHEALEHSMKVLELRRKHSFDSDPAISDALNGVALGMRASHPKDAEQAAEYLKEAVARLTAQWPGGHPRLALALANLGWLSSMGGEPARGLVHLQQAIEMYSELNLANSWWAGGAYRNAAAAYDRLGLRREAWDLLARIYDPIPRSCSEFVGVEKSLELAVRLHLGFGRVQQAREAADRFLAICITEFGADHVQLHLVRRAAAELSIEMGEPEPAREQFDEAARLLAKGTARPDQVAHMSRLEAEILRLEGDIVGAEHRARSALVEATAALSARHTDLAVYHETLARVHVNKGDITAAIGSLNEAIAGLESTLGLQSFRLVEPLLRVSRLHAQVGDTHLAQATHQRARTLADPRQFSPRVLQALGVLPRAMSRE